MDALYDPKAAHETALRNLLQLKGYKDLNAVRDGGRIEGKAEGIREGWFTLVLHQLDRRFGTLSEELVIRIRTLDAVQLETLGEDLLDFQYDGYLVAWFK